MNKNEERLSACIHSTGKEMVQTTVKKKDQSRITAVMEMGYVFCGCLMPIFDYLGRLLSTYFRTSKLKIGGIVWRQKKGALSIKSKL